MPGTRTSCRRSGFCAFARHTAVTSATRAAKRTLFQTQYSRTLDYAWLAYRHARQNWRPMAVFASRTAFDYFDVMIRTTRRPNEGTVSERTIAPPISTSTTPTFRTGMLSRSQMPTTTVA